MTKIILSSGLRFNASITALSLSKSSFEYSIYTSSPKKNWPIGTRENLNFRPLPFKIMNYLFGLKRNRSLREKDAIIFDNIVSCSSSDCDIFHGWATFSLKSAKKHKKRGAKFLLDRACPHIVFQENLLAEEAELTKTKYYPVSKNFLNRCLEEYDLADKIIVPSAYSANSFFLHGFKKDKIETIPLNASFYPNKKKIWDKNNKKFIVGTIGGNPLRKGLKYLVEAWQKLKLKDSILLIKTSQSELKKSKDLFEKIIKDNTIKIIPYIKDIESFYLNCDLFCLPSIDDGFGLVVLEAMSVGVPVIATKNVGASEMIKDNVNGFVGDKRDVDFLGNKIFALYKDRYLLREFSKNAFSFYQNHLINNLNYDARIINIYNKTISQI